MQPRDYIKVDEFEERGAFGGNIQLRVNRRRALVDPFPFIKRLLWERDYTFNHWEQIKRVRGTKDNPEIALSLFDFAQAFFGTYTPAQIAGYLEPLLISSGNSQRLLERVRGFETDYQIAILALQHKRSEAELRKACLYPINLGVGNINQLIRLNIPRKDLPKELRRDFYPWYFGNRDDVDRRDLRKLSIPFYFTWRGYRDAERRVKSPHHLVEALTCKEPRVIICHASTGPELADDFSMLYAYPEIDTSELAITRKKG